MASEMREPDGPSSSRRAGIEGRQISHDRTLEAIHQLEAALGAAGPGREAAWRNEVVAALGVLEVATAEEAENAAQPDSLLSDIKRTQPRLRHRVRGLRAQYQQLRDGMAVLRHELELPAEAVDVAETRQRLGWLLTAIRHQRARESDLIYEAYYDIYEDDLPPEI